MQRVRAHIEPQLEENRLAQSVLMSFFFRKNLRRVMLRVMLQVTKGRTKKKLNLKEKKGLRRSVGCFVVGGT